MDIKELAKIIDLCRKKGIESLKMNDLELKLGELPIPRKRAIEATESTPEDAAITQEDLLFWSSQGAPGDA